MDYTQENIEQILKDLEIEPYRHNKVDSNQAAKILNWRAETEQGKKTNYTPISIRRRTAGGDLHPEPISERLNIYDVVEVFALKIVPSRAAGGQQRRSKKRQSSL